MRQAAQVNIGGLHRNQQISEKRQNFSKLFKFKYVIGNRRHVKINDLNVQI